MNRAVVMHPFKTVNMAEIDVRRELWPPSDGRPVDPSVHVAIVYQQPDFQALRRMLVGAPSESARDLVAPEQVHSA